MPAPLNHRIENWRRSMSMAGTGRPCGLTTDEATELIAEVRRLQRRVAVLEQQLAEPT